LLKGGKKDEETEVPVTRKKQKSKKVEEGKKLNKIYTCV